MAKRQRTAKGQAAETLPKTDAEESVQLTDGWPLLSPGAQTRLTAIAGLSDCEIRIGDTIFRKLHKVKLAEASVVLRTVINSVEDSCTLTLHDDTPEQVALLISLFYESDMASMTARTIRSALQLATKYDSPDVAAAAQNLILRIKLDPQNFVSWLQVAIEYQLQRGIAKCVEHASKPVNLREIMTTNNDKWMLLLPVADVVRIFAPQFRASRNLKSSHELQ